MRHALALSLLTGCAALSGLDGMTGDLEDGVGVPDRSQPGGPDGGATSSSGGPNTNADGSANVDGSNPPSDGSVGNPEGGPTGSRIRDITFEDKALVHPTSGFDSLTGVPLLATDNPIGGLYSMIADGSGVFGTVSFPAVNDLYMTLRFRLTAASQVTAGDARLFRITHTGGAPIEAYIKASPRDFFVVQGAAQIATMANLLTDGSIYRVQLRMRSSGAVSINVTNGASTTSVGGSAMVGASSMVEVGSVTGGNMRVTVDDISIDSAMQP